jgi:spermidine synthase
MAKLYSRSFYQLCARRLTITGVLATHATSPFFAREAFSCIVKTVAEAVDAHPDLPSLQPVPYHVNVPSFGEWGFVLAGHHRIDFSALTPSVPTRFLTPGVLKGMAAFGRDIAPLPDVSVNRLDHPVLYEYYRRGWQAFAD